MERDSRRKVAKAGEQQQPKNCAKLLSRNRKKKAGESRRTMMKC
jgi:hypothetical protein